MTLVHITIVFANALTSTFQASGWDDAADRARDMCRMEMQRRNQPLAVVFVDSSQESAVLYGWRIQKLLDELSAGDAERWSMGGP